MTKKKEMSVPGFAAKTDELITVNYNAFRPLFDDKIAELTSRISKLKTDDNISKNTRGTQLYAKKRERTVLTLLKTAFSQAKQLVLTEEEQEKLVSLLTLTSERNSSAVKIKDGDSVLKLMQQYSEVKDVYGKLMSYAAKHGFDYDAATGIFTKRADAE